MDTGKYAVTMYNDPEDVTWEKATVSADDPFQGAMFSAIDETVVELQVTGQHNYILAVTDASGAAITDVTLDVDTPAGWSVTGLGGGRYNLISLEDGIRHRPDQALTVPVTMDLTARATAAVSSETRYEITVSTSQYEEVPATDQHPDGPGAGEPVETINLGFKESMTITGALNGSGDVDTFAVGEMEPGAYLFDLRVNEPETLVGMRLYASLEGAEVEIPEIHILETGLTATDGWTVNLANDHEGTTANYELTITNRYDEENSDFPADTSSSGRLLPDKVMEAAIADGADSDWIGVQMVKDQIYLLDIVTTSGDRTYLSEVRDETGNALDRGPRGEWDQESPQVRDTLYEIRPRASGLYFLEVEATGTSVYTLEMFEDDHPKVLERTQDNELAVNHSMEGTISRSWDTDVMDAVTGSGHNYLVTLETTDGSPVEDLEIGVSSDQSRKYTTVDLGNGQWQIRFVRDGVMAIPDEAQVTEHRTGITVRASHAVSSPIQYTVHLKTGQYAEVSALDQHPDSITPGGSHENIEVSAQSTVQVDGEINGNGDVDAFTVGPWPAGMYHVRFEVDEPLATVGMQALPVLNGTVAQQGLTEYFAMVNPIGEDAGRALHVTNYHDSTTLPYRMVITHRHGEDGNDFADDASTAAVLAGGYTAEAALQEADDTDLFRFYVQPGDTVRFVVEATDGNDLPSLEGGFRFWNGRTEVSSSQWTESSPDENTLEYEFTADPNREHTMYFLSLAGDGTDTGAYTVTMQEVLD